MVVRWDILTISLGYNVYEVGDDDDGDGNAPHWLAD